MGCSSNTASLTPSFTPLSLSLSLYKYNSPPFQFTPYEKSSLFHWHLFFSIFFWLSNPPMGWGGRCSYVYSVDHGGGWTIYHAPLGLEMCVQYMHTSRTVAETRISCVAYYIWYYIEVWQLCNNTFIYRKVGYYVICFYEVCALGLLR